MTTSTVPHSPIVSLDQWLDERKKLLVREKELTKTAQMPNDGGSRW